MLRMMIFSPLQRLMMNKKQNPHTSSMIAIINHSAIEFTILKKKSFAMLFLKENAKRMNN